VGLRTRFSNSRRNGTRRFSGPYAPSGGTAGGEGGPEELTEEYSEVAEVEHEVAVASAAEEAMAATYCGEQFVGAPRALGEPYEAHCYRAANPYLPFGTALLVSHGGRSVVVGVSDRVTAGSASPGLLPKRRGLRRRASRS
jgi:rare lipoprotein A (peptidoglycan hydrolase)